MERKEFNYNLLLEYLSYKKYGFWHDFRKYVENLSYDNVDAQKLKYRAYEICRMLSSLGHVEFIFGDKSYYSICPPAVALFEDSYSGVLCGYRTAEFLDSLESKCEEFDIDFIINEEEGSPDVVIIDFKNQDILNEFQSKYEQFISISQNFSSTLISKIPSVNDIVKNLQPIPFDKNEYGVKVFSRNYRKETFEFVPARGFGDREWDVYEMGYLNRREYILYGNDNKYYKADKSIALCKYFSENYNRVCDYYSGGILIFKHSGYFNYIPELIDRALTLSSGKNRESRNNGKVIYHNITPRLARMTIEKLGLRMEDHSEQ